MADIFYWETFDDSFHKEIKYSSDRRWTGQEILVGEFIV